MRSTLGLRLFSFLLCFVVPLPVFGGEGVLPGVDLSSNMDLASVMDEAAGLDALR